MSVKLIIEGGGDRKSKYLNQAFRREFAKFLGKAGLAGKLPSIEAAGGRQQAYDAFKSAHERGDQVAVLLVDAEAPVTARDPWTHLNTRDGWTCPSGATNDQCHLMVQIMESWFLADRPALQEFYGQHFRSQALPGNPNIEQIPKQDVLNRLRQASRPTPKGAYDKGAHSFEILASLDPAKVIAASPHARRFVQALRDLS
ncbi:MAG: DUF4276 family protein [bacterium]|nr:DUF4276 family protein [bacterium]MDE2920570.1 DUF4276 family protein [Chloroflexota bacterium]